jgi:hypothetical protein
MKLEKKFFDAFEAHSVHTYKSIYIRVDYLFISKFARPALLSQLLVMNYVGPARDTALHHIGDQLNADVMPVTIEPSKTPNGGPVLVCVNYFLFYILSFFFIKIVLIKKMQIFNGFTTKYIILINFSSL